MKLHPLTIVGAIIASLATGFYIYVGAQEFIGGEATIPFLFLALLAAMVVVSIATWFKPEPLPLGLAFVGIMLSTYNGSSARGDEFLPALLSGLPFIIAAILVWAGVRLRQKVKGKR